MAMTLERAAQLIFSQDRDLKHIKPITLPRLAFLERPMPPWEEPRQQAGEGLTMLGLQLFIASFRSARLLQLPLP